MIILISPEEIETEYANSWKLGHITNPNLDFATNCVHATFENKDIILYRFNKYGYFISNQKGTHEISAGPAGIIIKFYK